VRLVLRLAGRHRITSLATDQQDAARSFMLAIDSRYDELRLVPRRAEMRISGATRTLGEPDRRFIGRATVVQLDRHARFDMDTVLVDPGADSVVDCGRTPAGHLTWVSDGTSLKIRFRAPTPSAPPSATDHDGTGQSGAGGGVASRSAEPTGTPGSNSPNEVGNGEPGAQEMRVDFRRLPAELGWRFRDPMGEPELGREFLNHPFTLSDGVMSGLPVKILRSVSDVQFSHNSRAHVILWVDPDTLLIRRAAYDGAFVQSADGKVQAIEADMELSYQLGVPPPDGAFDLELGPDAKDITDLIAREGRAALGMLP
jgi:hypothetical protein